MRKIKKDKERKEKESHSHGKSKLGGNEGVTVQKDEHVRNIQLKGIKYNTTVLSSRVC